ncbi:MAG: hypothetical protein GY909_07990 [Oligoflexia bacterium]|nr:hypothetical protein [Oligoflexia bacterium]
MMSKNPFESVSPIVSKDNKFYKTSFKDDFSKGLAQLFLPKNGTWTFSSPDLKEIKATILENALIEKSVISIIKDDNQKITAALEFTYPFISRYIHYSMGGTLKTELKFSQTELKEITGFDIKIIEGLTSSIARAISFALSQSNKIEKDLFLDNVFLDKNLLNLKNPGQSFLEIEFWLKEDNSSFKLFVDLALFS